MVIMAVKLLNAIWLSGGLYMCLSVWPLAKLLNAISVCLVYHVLTLLLCGLASFNRMISILPDHGYRLLGLLSLACVNNSLQLLDWMT